jgi:hypothetical protein
MISFLRPVQNVDVIGSLNGKEIGAGKFLRELKSES